MKSFSRAAAAAYLLLAGVFAVYYWSHVDYFGDDWILLPLFRRAAEGGAAGVAELAVRAAQNRIYEVFRMQWLSILWGLAVTWAGGYAVHFNFALLLLLHAANAWLLCQGLVRLGADRGFAFVAGALMVVLPTTRFVLFTYFTNPFFVFCTFWVLLMLWWWAGAPERRAWALGPLAVAGMFAGEQAFVLLAAIVPLAAWTRPEWRRAAAKATAVVWGSMAVALAVYLGAVNRMPPVEGSRYRWAWHVLRENLSLIGQEWWRLTGLPPDAPFRLQPSPADFLAATLAAAVVWFLARGWMDDGIGARRLAALAVLGLIAAYAPTLWVFGGFALRYHYVSSPFLAVLLAAGCRALGRRAAPGLAAFLVGFFLLTAACDLRQCWIPASVHHRTFRAELERMHDLQPGDTLVATGAPFEIGTAQHFSLHSADTATPFAEWITGVRPLHVALGLAEHRGHLVLFLKMDHWRQIADADLPRTRVLVYNQQSVFEHPEWLARRLGGGRFRLLPLKGAADPGGMAGAVVTREQVAMLGRRAWVP